MSRTIAEIQEEINAVDDTMQALQRMGENKAADRLWERLDDRMDELFTERIQAGGSSPAGTIAIMEEK